MSGKLWDRVSGLVASLGHPKRSSAVSGHTLNTVQHVITKKSHSILNEFTILCWAVFTAILGHMRPVGPGWTPLRLEEDTWTVGTCPRSYLRFPQSWESHPGPWPYQPQRSLTLYLFKNKHCPE